MLVLLIIGSLLVAALVADVGNDLRNTTHFSKARSLSYDASSAINVAIQSIRYTPLLAPTETLNASPPAPCWPTTTFATGEPTSPLPNTGGNNFRVWCSTRWMPKSVRTRTVTLSACTEASLAPTKAGLRTEAIACAARPRAREVVSFDDYPAAGGPATGEPCQTTCGTTVTVDSFVAHPTMPTVTGLSCVPSSASCVSAPADSSAPVGGPITGGATFTISGTGFVPGATTVQFVEEGLTGGPNQDNEVLTGKNVAVRSSGKALTVTVPATTEGSTYFVTVTTPVGTSAFGGGERFKYTTAPPTKPPTVTRVCTGPAGSGRAGTPQTTCNSNDDSTYAQGAVAGGSELTIWGANFFCPTSCTLHEPTVAFVSGTKPPVKALHVTVVADTELTVTTPAEDEVIPTGTPKGAEFSVEVDTKVTSVAFDYVPIVPTVLFVSYNTSTKSVTVTGTGFVKTDDTVGFAKVTGCTPHSTTKSKSTTVLSPTTISATVPTSGSPSLMPGTYFVTVTSKSAGTATSTCNPPTFTLP